MCRGILWGPGSAGGDPEGSWGLRGVPRVGLLSEWVRDFGGSQGKEGGRCFNTGISGSVRGGCCGFWRVSRWNQRTQKFQCGGCCGFWGVSGLTWARRKKCGRCFMALPLTQATLPKRPGCAARSARIRARVNAATFPRSSSPSASVCGKRSASATAGTAGQTLPAPPHPLPAPSPTPSVPPVLTQQPPVAAPHVCELHAGRGGPGGGVGRKKSREERGPVHVLRAGGAAGTAGLLLTGNRAGAPGAPGGARGEYKGVGGGW